MARVSLAIEVSADLVRQIRAILPPGRTVESYIEELLVGPVLTEHFVKLTAPEEYYEIAEPVSQEEVSAFQELAAEHARSPQSQTARLREVLDDVNAAPTAGTSHPAVLATLHARGFTLRSFESTPGVA
jgi:hypothetical protein